MWKLILVCVWIESAFLGGKARSFFFAVGSCFSNPCCASSSGKRLGYIFLCSFQVLVSFLWMVVLKIYLTYVTDETNVSIEFSRPFHHFATSTMWFYELFLTEEAGMQLPNNVSGVVWLPESPHWCGGVVARYFCLMNSQQFAEGVDKPHRYLSIPTLP